MGHPEPQGGAQPPGIISTLNQPTPGLPGVFGFAMPGNWLDGVNDGWVHSWNVTPIQVNLANATGGFSGPRIVPLPAALWLLGAGVLGYLGLGGARREDPHTA